MSRKYYCELCDKRFADNALNRKNHMKGVQHQRMKKMHYDTFRGEIWYTCTLQSQSPVAQLPN